jgi:hypothetical protein
MNKFPSILTFLLVVLAVYWSFRSSMPSYAPDIAMEETSFSTDRALQHVAEIAKMPHAVGFPAHEAVRSYILSELNKMGLETRLQEGYTAGDWGNLSKATNILARIKGSGQGKALMLLSHYDSSPHSSLGASDAGSGVATILEGVRAFLAEHKTPKNDIIILISDAEELGLNGADLFVNQHQWAGEVGLVLNFEARGSGGPSYMLIETNRGNANLIKEFTAADTHFPVANSLVYSIYKMLPNDTDLTVFREDRDIEGFNFAFIDDHFDYHTVRDDYDRLDRKTLAHQGTYLMPLLRHFSEADLDGLKSLNDMVYFNMPFFRLVTYPFDWIWPMWVLAVLVTGLLLFFGFRKKSFTLRQSLMGFLPMLIALGINGMIGFYAYRVLQWIYPEYSDMLHGFTYNGYTYILAFVLISISVCFWSYHKFKSISAPNLLVGPLLLWLALCYGVACYLPGASFFIIPVFALLASLLVLINQKEPNPYLLVFLSLPALWLYAPFIKMFPVGLGLKMMVASTLLTTLTFVLLLMLFSFYKNKKHWASFIFLLFLASMLIAHFNADFTPDRAKPSSLLYVLDTDLNTSKWATYDHVLIDWNDQFLGKDKHPPDQLSERILSSKYGSGFSFVSAAPMKPIAPPLVETETDTIIGDQRWIEVTITPQRQVNRLELFTNEVLISSALVNNVPLSKYYLENRNGGKLLTHYISNNEPTHLRLGFPKDSIFELTMYEASNDLLENPQFTIPERPASSIPMPFIVNDAILVIKTLKFE